MTADGPNDAGGGMPPWPRRPARLATAVVSDLADRIVSGVFPENTNLPTEPLLCETFGVSRTVVREAVKGLEERGLVKARQGQGTTVCPYDDWNLLDPVVLEATVRHDAELSILDDLVDVRRALEAQMAGQAARRASSEHLERIDTLLAQLAEEVVRPGLYIQTDILFHDAIMLASGNRLGRSVVRMIHAEARASSRYNGHPTRRDCEMSNAGHTAICGQLHLKDPEGAAEAMNDHILGSWLHRRPGALEI